MRREFSLWISSILRLAFLKRADRITDTKGIPCLLACSSYLVTRSTDYTHHFYGRQWDHWSVSPSEADILHGSGILPVFYAALKQLLFKSQRKGRLARQIDFITDPPCSRHIPSFILFFNCIYVLVLPPCLWRGMRHWWLRIASLFVLVQHGDKKYMQRRWTCEREHLCGSSVMKAICFWEIFTGTWQVIRQL